MSDFSIEQIARSIAEDVWPNGGILSCTDCDHSERITTEQCGQYLAEGWPTHCGATMQCEAAPSRTPTDHD